MTSHEHGVTTKYATIYLLGYLIPTMTGGRDLYVAASEYRHRQQEEEEEEREKRTGRKRARTEDGGGGGSSSTLLSGNATDFSGGSSLLLLGNVLELELEEILECCTTAYTNGQIGAGGGCCMDEQVSSAFHRLIRHGIGPFLSARAAHPTVTDLIHVMAMAISPTIIMKPIGDDEKKKESTQKLASSPSYQRAVRLMNCPHSHSFQTSYDDRLELVRMLASSFVAPDVESLVSAAQQGEDQTDDVGNDGVDQSAAAAPTSAAAAEDSPMIDGALIHLRLALQSFAMGALSVCDTSAARRAMVNIAITSGHVPFIEDAATNLVDTLADCRDVCRCQLKKPRNSSPADPGCSYDACGKLLRDLILRHNGSRHYADEVFTRRTLVLVSVAVVSLTDSIVLTSADVRKDKNAVAGICQLCSLLGAARSLFFFLLPGKALVDSKPDVAENPDICDASGVEAMDIEKDEVCDEAVTGMSQEEEKEARDALLKSSVVLLNHPDIRIVEAASSLLSLAFAYGGKEDATPHIGGIYTAIKCCLQEEGSSDESGPARVPCKKRINALQGVVSVLSRHSTDFADMLMSQLVSGDTSSREPILYVALSIAQSRPRVVAKYLVDLFRVVKKPSQVEQLIAVCLSCRLANYFSSEEPILELQQRVGSLMENVKDPWVLFQLCRHAFCTANFGIADEIVSTHLLKGATSEKSHLFYVSVMLTARAEHIISEKGALGIAQALPSIESAKSHLRSLQSLTSESGCTPLPSSDFSFQLETVACRIDFLHLCVVLRGLCGEMRLVNTGPPRGTRARLHQRNVIHCFYLLASRYASTYRRYGLFRCQQTRTSLRTLSALCRFMARASAKTFVESTHGAKSRLYEFHEAAGAMWPEGDAAHPITRIISKLSESVLSSMDETVEPNIRAAAMMEMLDPVLRCPLPSPRGFFSAQKLPYVELRVHADPDEVLVAKDEESSHDHESVVLDAEVIQIPPGHPTTLYATGHVPDSLRSLASLPFSQISAWYKMSYDGPLVPYEDVDGDDQQGIEDSADDGLGTNGETAEAAMMEDPFSAPLRLDGKFSLPIVLNAINREGYYMLRLTLGCRDARCGEFELAAAGKNAGVVALCVTSQALGDSNIVQ